MAISKAKSLFSHFQIEYIRISFSNSVSTRGFSSSNTSSIVEKVGFVGLGNMGSRMAMNLAKSGFKVSVHDINSEATRAFLHMGISVKETPAEVAKASDVVVTMLPSASHVLNVYTGSNGLLQNGRPSQPWLFIDSSTIDVQTSRKLSLIVSEKDLKETTGEWEHPVMLDAPVSGGILAAEAGTLTFMVGGPKQACLAANPLFSSMGKGSIYCGPSGSGSAAKICNNLALAVSMIGASEAFALGQSLGLASKTLTKVFNTSSARCWCSDSYNPVPGVMDGVPSARNYQGGFASKLMAKDLDLAADSAKEVGIRSPLTSQAREIFHELCKGGHEMDDFSCVFRYFYHGKDEN